jgi:hypothetical protein
MNERRWREGGERGERERERKRKKERERERAKRERDRKETERESQDLSVSICRVDVVPCSSMAKAALVAAHGS